MCQSNPRLARNRFQVRNSVRPMHLFGHTLDHDYYFELPREGERDTQFLDVLLHTIAISGLSRVSTELCQLLVTPRAASFKSLYQKQPLQILTRLLTSSAV